MPRIDEKTDTMSSLSHEATRAAQKAVEDRFLLRSSRSNPARALAILAKLDAELTAASPKDVETLNPLATPPSRKRYTATQLNAMCDPDAPMPDELVTKDAMPEVGSETSFGNSETPT
jgi:hypothetical protein